MRSLALLGCRNLLARGLAAPELELRRLRVVLALPPRREVDRGVAVDRAAPRLAWQREQLHFQPAANFRGLVLGCIEAKLCKKICV